MAKSGPKTPAVPNEELRTRLIDATVVVLARDGFARASGRAIAEQAGTVNGSIFYWFGSMDGLLASTASALAERGIERLRASLGGEAAHAEWPSRLAAVMRAEAAGEDGRAVMELFVAARTSPALAAEVRGAIDRAIDYATAELTAVLGSSPVTQLIPIPLLAELAAGAFLGLEVLAQNGREVDLDHLATVLETAVKLLGGGRAT